MEVSDYPLLTPPSNPPDAYERIPSPRETDPLTATPELSHPVIVEAFTSDLRDQPPSPRTPRHQLPHKVDIPSADSVSQFDRRLSDLPMSMDVNDSPIAEMVNGHKGRGEYTAEDMFSGPAVESPLLTNEPTPPPTGKTPLVPLSNSSRVSTQPSQTSTPANLAGPDITMKDAPLPLSALKPFHEPPTTDEPPAKRLKTEPLATYDTTKKIPANQTKFLGALLRQVKKSKDAGPFLVPVDPVKLNLPRYFDVVSRPMDISTIEKKLNGSAYPVVQALVDDFNLMIDNCVKFNGLDNPVTKMGRNVQVTFEKGMKTLPPEQQVSPSLCY
jgi:hypothetical protein